MPLFPPPFPQPLIIADEAISATAAITATFTNANVFLYAFEVLVATTFSGARWHTGATATGATDIGIYSFAGNLLASLSGGGAGVGVANVANSTQTPSFNGGNITLQPGQYFMALCESVSTDTITGKAGIVNSGAANRWRLAVNAPNASFSLPATTGGYTDSPSNVPAFALIVVGGLT
jgi:hypothetical protein